MTPRPYLSYGQLILWEKDPEEYMRRYFAGKKMRINRGMGLGKEIADALESGEETGDFEKDFVIAQFPQYELRDVPIVVFLGGREKGIPILIKPDSIKVDLSAFHEYKTGTTKWTQKKVDEDDQLTYYATGCYLDKKVIPKIQLHWAPTRHKTVEGPDGPLETQEVELTGEVKHFDTIRRMTHVLRMMARMKKAWREINARCDAEVV